MTNRLFAALAMFAHAGAPALDNIQLQRLIQSAQRQIALTEELLKVNRGDAEQIARASAALERLTKGIDQQVARAHSTREHDQAVLKLQAGEGGILADETLAPAPAATARAARRQNGTRVQAELHRAQTADVVALGRLTDELDRAPNGLLPRLGAQVGLANWQTQVRVANQLAEIAVTLREIERDLNDRGQRGDGFEVFLDGWRDNARGGRP